MLDQQMPEAVGALVEVRHREIERDSLPVERPAAPDRRMREKPLVDPGIAMLELLGSHVPGLKNGVGGVVESPIAMQEAAFRLHLPKQRSCRIRSENVKGGALL